MKRTWFHRCILALFVVLSGCGKGEHGQDAHEAAASASAVVQPSQSAKSAEADASGKSVRQDAADGRDTIAVEIGRASCRERVCLAV